MMVSRYEKVNVAGYCRSLFLWVENKMFFILLHLLQINCI